MRVNGTRRVIMPIIVRMIVVVGMVIVVGVVVMAFVVGVVVMAFVVGVVVMAFVVGVVVVICVVIVVGMVIMRIMIFVARMVVMIVIVIMRLKRHSCAVFQHKGACDILKLKMQRIACQCVDRFAHPRGQRMANPHHQIGPRQRARLGRAHGITVR
ncbi:MAG: hypothetical protein ACJARC_000627 [Sulfitobacter sp.]|jgi:hypothetical protein